MKPIIHTLRSRLVRLVFLGLAGATLAFAQAGSGITEPMPPTTAPRGDGMHADTPGTGLTRGDRAFFEKAARLGEKEVLLSRHASERAADPQVRAFAAEMVRVHTTANDELAALAARKGVTPADRKSASERADSEKKWNDKKADKLDADYLEAMIEAHDDTVDVLERGAGSKDTEISAYANRHLPVVKSHLERAKQLKQQLTK